MADHYIPEEEVHTRKYAMLLKDIWWRLCTKAGNIFKAPITRYGANGLPDGETTPEIEFGWNRENIAKLSYKLDLVLKNQEEGK